jgi:acyl carrier protein
MIAKGLGVRLCAVQPNEKLIEDLDADSLDAIEMSMTFEDYFDIEIHDEDLNNIKTVKDIHDYLKRVL